MTEQDVDRDAGSGEGAEEPDERTSTDDPSGSEHPGGDDADTGGQDATDEAASADGDEAPSTTGDEEATTRESAGQTATEDATAESLDDIAERPAGDVDEALSDIVGGESDSDADGTESTADDDSTESTADDDSEDAAEPVERSLVEDVREAAPERIASAIKLLREEIEDLEDELATERERADDLESRLKRKQADFQNYKKRQKRKLEDEKQRATEDLVRRLLDVRDNLVRALEQDEGVDIRDGVQTTLDQFDHELDRENVEPIEPDPGDSVDPTHHEVLATVASDQPADTIAQVHRPGYRMAEKVLRPAQVAVSDGSANDDEDGDDAENGGEAEGAEDAADASSETAGSSRGGTKPETAGDESATEE